MDESQRPYEYDEESNFVGFLLFFCLMLTTCDLFIAISDITQVYSILKSLPLVANLFLGFGIFYLVIGLGICVVLYFKQWYAPNAAKIFLILRLLFLAGSTLVIYNFRIHNPNLIGDAIYQFKSIQELVWHSLTFPLIYISVFSFLWLLYFLTSKKVRKIYKKA